jgi:hypothetical protein
MPKTIIRSFKLREISSVDFPAQEGARMTIMKSAGTQAARDASISALREKRIQTAMDEHGLTRKEAEAMVGLEQNVKASEKRAPTEADTAVASIEALADYDNPGATKHAGIAKFLKTDTGKSLYQSYSDARNEPAGRAITKRQYSNAFERLVDVYAKEFDGNRWKAANAALKTKLGTAMYKAMNEAA